MSASAPGSEIERTNAAMRPSSPRSSRISSTTARYSVSSVADVLAGRRLVRALVGLDEETAPGVGLGCARDRAVEAVQRHGGVAAGQPHPVGHLGDGADLGVLAVVLGDEQHALLVADVDRQGHVHVGEDDDVVERDEQELAHSGFTLLGGTQWSIGHTGTNYKKCTGIPAPRQRRRRRSPQMLTERVQTRRPRRRVSVIGARFPEYRLPGPDTVLRPRTPRAWPRASMGARLRASIVLSRMVARGRPATGVRWSSGSRRRRCRRPAEAGRRSRSGVISRRTSAAEAAQRGGGDPAREHVGRDPGARRSGGSSR